MAPVTPILDFTLPDHLEAHEPPEARGLWRDQVRMLVTDLLGDRVEHTHFAHLADYLRPGDLVVANDSATLPAALHARRADGADIALHLSTRLPAGLWIVEPRKVTVAVGETLSLAEGGMATMMSRYPGSVRLWIARLDLPDGPLAFMQQWGRPIAYSYVRDSWPIAMYQTIFARVPGSAEMPSAGRAFTPDVLERLALRGIDVATLTLHTGVASLEDHEPPYEEYYEVPIETADKVRSAKLDGRRVIAVGTTVVRALESAADERGRVIASRGWTDLVITAERGVRIVDGLVTGFHEPKATHLAMLEAIASPRHLEVAYRAALDGGYLWHEFGDLHLIL